MSIVWACYNLVDSLIMNMIMNNHAFKDPLMTWQILFAAICCKSVDILEHFCDLTVFVALMI